MSHPVAREHARRQSHTARIAQLFLSRPFAWIDASELEAVGGRYAWRTRCSEFRKAAERRGWTVENRQRRPRGRVISEYCYRPLPLGPSAEAYRDARLF